MKYCSQCGHSVGLIIPEGDNRERFVCGQCSVIHYQNPRIVAGSLPTYDNKVLLCKRAIEPQLGYWTLPAGFMENDETTLEAAIRETTEEANAKIDIQELYTLINVAHINQVHLFYRATLIDLDFYAGQESLDVALFAEKDIPWEDIAFPTVKETLKFYFSDRKLNEFPLRTKDIKRFKS